MSNRTLAEAISLLKAKQFPLEELFAKLESSRARDAERDGAKAATIDVPAADDEFEILAGKIKILAELLRHQACRGDIPQEGIFAQAREAGVDLAELRDQLLQLKHELLIRRYAGRLPPTKSRSVDM